ncbi:MAG TPA: hypothetical protein VMM85_04335 [Methylomirabilota bacterium]|nr:hypothetical protein [Methylomirabilota bacterium]
MHTRRHARGSIAAILAVMATLILAVGTASAHRFTVDPRGSGDPDIVNEPISQPYAQAHCHAQSPAVVSGASGGVVSFSPAEALPCPADVTNPGGQVTGP